MVYLTSCAGYTPGLDVGLLSVASTGVLSLTKNVALSAARRGVRVNAVCFGMVGFHLFPMCLVLFAGFLRVIY